MKKIILSLIISFCSLVTFAQNDTTINVLPSIEAKLIEADKAAQKAKEDLLKINNDVEFYINLLFEIEKKKRDEYDIVSFDKGILRIKKKKKEIEIKKK